MNHFALFDAATKAYVNQTLRIARWTQPMQEALEAAKVSLPGIFRQGARIDYSTTAVRLAYSYHYAPKHATIWEMYLAAARSAIAGSLEFITLGPGPGSEVFGILEANRPPRGSVVTVHCLERVGEWEPLFGFACDHYRASTGIHIRREYYDSVTDLPPRLPVVGSLFLSELIRDNDLHPFLSHLQHRVGPSAALFLDNVLCKAWSGNREVVYGVPEMMGFAKFPNYLRDLNLGTAERCNRDSRQAHCLCHVDLPGEPGMCFIPRRLQ